MLVDVNFNVVMVMTALYEGPLCPVDLTEVQLSAALHKRGRQNSTACMFQNHFGFRLVNRRAWILYRQEPRSNLGLEALRLSCGLGPFIAYAPAA